MVVGVGRRDTYGCQRLPGAGQTARGFLSLACPDLPDSGRSASPFFALMLAASTTARDQSISPRLYSSSSTAWCSRHHNRSGSTR